MITLFTYTLLYVNVINEIEFTKLLLIVSGKQVLFLFIFFFRDALMQLSYFKL